jgi:periplasmic copper chaperone A
MSKSTTRRAGKLAAVGSAAIVATVALPGIAQAHVTVQPGTTEGGEFTAVAFRVPNERDDASTTKIQVVLPADQPIGSVQTRPMQGWKITTQKRHLAQPIDFFGTKLDSVVSKITWTATDGGLAPGQYNDFNVSLGPLPKSGSLAFRALQTYSTGEQVNWNEVSTDPSVEPEHPAPTLTLTAPAPEAGTAGNSDTAGNDNAAGGAAQAAAQNTAQADSSSTLTVVLAGGALLVSLVTAAFSWRRRQTPSVEASAPSQRPLDRTGV